MLKDLIQEAGVVGAGGAGFPTHVKLNARAEYFIVNAAECEPLIETDKYLCRKFPNKIVEIANKIGEYLEASHVVIALKRQYVTEIEALEQAIREKNLAIQLFLMDSFYPAGDEQVMVQQVCGRSVPERGIPLAVGAVVDNVGTLVNIFDALNGIPVTDKYLSVTGMVEKPIMVKVPLGTPVLDCLKVAKISANEYDLILGGPMMGKIYTNPKDIAELSVTKTTGNLLVLPKDHHLSMKATKPLSHIIRQTQSSCIQCRMCTEMCPRYQIGHNIHPHKIMRAIFWEPQVTEKEEYLHLYGEAANCSDCGLCEQYACPMGLSPRKVNTYLKSRLREQKIDVPRNLEPYAREANIYGKASTYRLIARLGLSDYVQHCVGNDCIDLKPERVIIPFSQHIGKPAVPIKGVGDVVKKGELLASAPEDALGANIHVSMDGVIEFMDERCAIIKAEGCDK